MEQEKANLILKFFADEIEFDIFLHTPHPKLDNETPEEYLEHHKEDFPKVLRVVIEEHSDISSFE